MSEPEIDSLVGYLREFCTEPGWPRGDLNFPRPFFTEKAFPENEAVFTLAIARPPEASVEPQFLYEHRLGRRAQYEINVPIAFHQDVGRFVEPRAGRRQRRRSSTRFTTACRAGYRQRGW